MSLNTENASAIVPGVVSQPGAMIDVKVLIGTFVKSVGRDVRVGEVVAVSAEDYRFLKPYKYVTDATDEVENEAPAPAPAPAEESVVEDTDAEESAPVIVEGKRAGRKN